VGEDGGAGISSGSNSVSKFDVGRHFCVGGREEVAEEVLSLEFRGILKFYPDIHATRTAERRVKLVEMVRGTVKKISLVPYKLENRVSLTQRECGPQRQQHHRGR
jgi:hypothetical protein